MRTLGEIELPVMKPAMEWIRGRAIQKMSPTYSHGVLQAAFLSHLSAWAQGRGRVVPEWRFRVTVPGGKTHPLVPDVAYMSFERLRTA